MKSVPVFQLAETELRTGTSLVEASAGTGKTYTIAGLFLRLILEKNLSVREILVVTDHNAYHIGEFAILRQVMGTWPVKREI